MIPDFQSVNFVNMFKIEMVNADYKMIFLSEFKELSNEEISN